MKSIFKILCVATLSLASCINNDIPYPVIELEITKVEGVGFTQKSIDISSGTATITLDETTDIRAVEITNVEYTEDATLTSAVEGTFDMRSPITTSLYLYQSYDWSIVAEQTITRYFKVVGQIGDERIDTTQLTVEVDVNEDNVDLSNVTITSMKLGPEEVTTYSPTLEVLTNTSFQSVRRVTVTAHDRSETWSIYVNLVEPSVVLTVDAWGTIAWLSAVGDTTDPDECSFAYRKSGDTEWIAVDATSAQDGVFAAKITGLSPETDYEFEAYVGDDNSGGITATTESTPTLPNGGFENWWKPSKAWLPYGEYDDPFWGTGNGDLDANGSVALGTTNITSPDDTTTAPNSDGVYSAKLSSEKIAGFFAAGNIFTGRFYSVDIPGGIIAMGRPFTQRPLGLRGWVKYNQGTVTDTDSDQKLSVGDPDQGSLYIALGTWDAATYGKDKDGSVIGDSTSPIIINTNDKSTFFDSSTDAVIAYGELIFTQSQEEWKEFEIELEYRDLTNSSGTVLESAQSRVPTHILIVGSSSRYGDYFTGSTSSKMWLDDMELIYE